MVKLTVIGAGVIGLTTAVELQKQLPNAEIVVISEKFDKETTSDGAAGIFRPGTSFCASSDELTRYIIRESYRYYDNILKSYDPKSTGVSEVSGYIFSSTSKSLTRNHLIEDILPTYREVFDEELKLYPGDWKYGSYYTTVITECRRFLPWLFNQFVTNNGKVIKQTIEQLSDVKSLGSDVVINCTGFGAKYLCNDHKLVPIRGQVFKVTAPWLKHFVYADYDTYIIPGQGNVTLGGCRNYDSYDLSISRYDSAAIWDRCTSLVPRLKQVKIDREWVGLRPHRDPVRLETERINEINFVHNYGHGGYGVTTAPGSALVAVQLVKEQLRMCCKL